MPSNTSVPLPGPNAAGETPLPCSPSMTTGNHSHPRAKFATLNFVSPKTLAFLSPTTEWQGIVTAHSV